VPEAFVAYLRSHVAFSEEELSRIVQTGVSRKLRQKQHLLTEGTVWRLRIFVLKGLLRTYVTDQQGDEWTLQLSGPGEWSADGESLVTGKPSVFNIEALENSEVFLLGNNDLRALLPGIPLLNQLLDLMALRHFRASQHRIYIAAACTAEQKYAAFLQRNPGLAGRVPLNILASYLGVVKETLSRARKRK
jgi:CRP-like cAMP-binding protein